MEYSSYRYLWPTRPEVAIAPTAIGAFERLGWWAQAKMDGTNTTIYVPPMYRDVRTGTFAMGRHGPEHRTQWQPGTRWLAFQESLPGGGWYAFQGELLHNRGVGVRDTVYLFDLLVADGEYLVGETYQERWHRLAALCRVFAADQLSHEVIGPGVWLATYRQRAFSEWFEAIRDQPEKAMVEGLVFKNPAGRLLPCTRATANAVWQRKCRRASKRLSF